MTTPRSKVDVALLSDNEIPAAFEVLSKSFGHDAPFINAYFPNHATPAGRVQGTKRLAIWKQTADSTTFLKATTQVGQEKKDHIVGLAIWAYIKEAPPTEIDEEENAEEVWPDKDDHEFMRRLWRDFVKPRTQAVKDSRGQGVFVLELLAVHPEYQGLGAGTALVRWGTKFADEHGYKAIVESSPKGRPVYEKCGFHTEIEEIRFDVGKEFAGRQIPKLTFLTREPQF